MNTMSVRFLLAAALMFSAASADALPYQFNVFMDGLQEAPTPVATPGTGFATVTFDSATGAMNVNGSFQDLIGTANNAHIHGYSAVGVASGVIFGLTFTPSTAGTVTGSGVIPPASIADVLAGLTYLNIHSTFRPGGEIRGQLFPPVLVPEPASGLLMAIAAGGFFGLRRRVRP